MILRRLGLALLLMAALIVPSSVVAQSARETLQDCIVSPERHTVAECDAAYQRWKTVRADRFLPSVPATATPTVTATRTPTLTPTNAPISVAPALAIPATADMAQAAITWFGQVSYATNYGELRLARDGSTLLATVTVVDHDLSQQGDAVEVTVGTQTQRVALSPEVPWRGTGFDDGQEDRGWLASFRFPNVGPGVTLPYTASVSDRFKPTLRTSGRLRTSSEPFTPAIGQPEVVELRPLRDASVGGAGTCAADIDPDFFGKFGTTDRTNDPDFNIQNQSDVADFPCWGRWYVVFPALSGRVARAELVLHQFGNAGGAEWNPPAERSSVQAATTALWDGRLTWNTAPSPERIVSHTWVDLMRVPLVWPGVERILDVSAALVPGQSTALVLYTADLNYHSGKYFVSNKTGDWNAAGRPKLRVTIAR